MHLFLLGRLFGEHEEHREDKQAGEHRESAGVVRIGGGQEAKMRTREKNQITKTKQKKVT